MWSESSLIRSAKEDDMKRLLFLSTILSVSFLSNSSDAQDVEGGLLYYSESMASNACDGRDTIDTAILGWETAVESHGVTCGLDNLVYASELADSARVSWGDDTGSLNVDENDMTLISLHGGVRPVYYDSYDDGSPSYTLDRTLFLLGNEGGNGNTEAEGCYTYGRDMYIGNGDVEFVHAVSCQSLQYEAIWNNQMVGLSRKIHQYGGFHGNVAMAATAFADDFAEDAFDGPVAWAWLDNMRISTTTCPTSAIMGDNQTNSHTRRDSETYNYPEDYDDPDTTPFLNIYFYGYCNPEHGSILPG